MYPLQWYNCPCSSVFIYVRIIKLDKELSCSENSDYRDGLLGLSCIDLNPETKDVTSFGIHLSPLSDAETEKRALSINALDLFVDKDEDEGREGPWEVVYNWKVFPRLNRLSEVGTAFELITFYSLVAFIPGGAEGGWC